MMKTMHPSEVKAVQKKRPFVKKPVNFTGMKKPVNFTIKRSVHSFAAIHLSCVLHDTRRTELLLITGSART